MAGRWLWALEADATRPQLKLFDPAGPAPAVGFSASVADLAKFVGWAFRLARTGQPEVLRALTLREMLRVHYVSSDWGTNRRRRLSATLFVSGGVRFSP